MTNAEDDKSPAHMLSRPQDNARQPLADHSIWSKAPGMYNNLVLLLCLGIAVCHEGSDLEQCKNRLNLHSKNLHGACCLSAAKEANLPSSFPLSWGQSEPTGQ